MRPCDRCGRWFRSNTATQLCDPCWEELGQMKFWQDEDAEAYNEPPVPPRYPSDTAVDNDDDDDDEYLPPIDTVFDREEEARGYQ